MPDKQRPQKTFRIEDFPKRLLRSFTPASYPGLASEEPSASALYLVGVIFLIVLLVLPVLYTGYERAFAPQRAHIERAVPDVVFQNGSASFEGKQPYTYEDEYQSRKRVVIVDTTGQTTTVPDTYDVGILITDKAIVHRIGDQTAEVPIPSSDKQLLARRFFVDGLERTKWVTFAMHGGAIFFFFLLLMFILAGLAAAVGFALDRLRKSGRLLLRARFSISAHAVTPMAFTAASMLSVRTPAQFYLLLGVPFLLFILLATFGARACLQAQEAT